jgi:N,N'-diacetyllegionaminate synthase
MNKVEIIAEIANAHQGDSKTALNLAKQVLDAGADAVKFQIYFAHELLVRSHPRYAHFEKQSFRPDVWRDLILKVKESGARVYCDVFGIEALNLAMELDVDGFKIHSSDMGNNELLQKLASYPTSRIFLSTGGCSAREIANAIELIGIKHRPILLHGFQSYPTAVEDSNLLRLVWLKEQFGSRTDIGYQDHVDATDPFSVTLPLLAIAMGARFIEKHVTLDRALKGVDYYSSLEPFEFKNFISEVRKTEYSIGVRPDSFSHAEYNYRNTVKKKWVAASKLYAGKILSPNDLCMKRIHDNSKDVVELDKLIGRPLLRDVEKEEMVCRSDVKTVAWAMVVARSRSTRLPGKAMLDVAGMPALQHLLERVKQAQSLDRIILCTTTNDEDTPLAQLALSVGIPVHRGAVEDVLGRMLGAINEHEVDVVLRITGDDILVDPIYIDRGLQYHLNSNAEYSDLKDLPSGTEVEYFDAKLLKEIHLLAKDPNWTEYLTFYITQNKDQYRTSSVPVEKNHSLDWRLTLDTVEDYEVIRILLEAMSKIGKPLDYRLEDIIEFFELNPDVLAINSNIRQRQFIPQINTTIEWNRLLQFSHK